MSRNLLALLVIVVITTLFIVLWDSPPESFRRQPDQATQFKYPQTYLTNVETIQYDEKGWISHTFRADKIAYFQRNPKRKTKHDYTLIDAPYIVMLDPKNPPWYASAQKGRANAQGTEIKLWGKVKIWRTSEDGNTSELSTSQLIINPDAQYAETNKPVMISSADGVTRAVGMKAYLKQDRIKLLSKVRGIHEPI